MERIKTSKVENITSFKELFISSILMIALSIGSTWASIVTDELWIKSLSFISIVLIILVNGMNGVKMIKEFFSKKKNHER